MTTFTCNPLPHLNATLITFEIEGGVIEVEEAFALSFPQVALSQGIILSGRGPIWLFARLVHHYHPALWVAVHDPRIGYIVVQSHSKERKEGEVITNNL